MTPTARRAPASEPDSIVGADGGISRHDAMMLGEAGADYVAFGPAGAARERRRATTTAKKRKLDLVGWWSDVFVVPVVAFGIETAEDAARHCRREPGLHCRPPAAPTPVGHGRRMGRPILAAIGAPVAAPREFTLVKPVHLAILGVRRALPRHGRRTRRHRHADAVPAAGRRHAAPPPNSRLA